MQTTRRQFLRLSSVLGSSLALGDLLRLSAAAPGHQRASADGCILIFLNGGLSHIDSFDPKPDQPDGVRGEFATMRTRVPGMHVTEVWPRLAALAHRYAVVRTVGFEGRLGNHSPACYHMLTGHDPQGEAAVLAPPRPDDHPTLGSMASRLRPTPGTVPAFVMVPDVLVENAHLTPGQFAGWLGSRYEALRVRGETAGLEAGRLHEAPATFALPALGRDPQIPLDRLAQRRRLLDRLATTRSELGASLAGRELDPYYERAFDLLTSNRAQAAFDLSAEPMPSRERYGRNVVGQSVLLGRRLIEAGVRFVNVHWPNVGGGNNWDTHSNGFRRLRDTLVPPADRALSALLCDLEDRGFLERTLVVLMTEFGRAPYIGRTFQNSGGPGGRDHWSNCFSIVMAGGGVGGGRSYGRSGAKGAFPADKPVAPADIVATILHALGIDPRVTLRDSQGRTHLLCSGTVLSELF